MIKIQITYVLYDFSLLSSSWYKKGFNCWESFGNTNLINNINIPFVADLIEYILVIMKVFTVQTQSW